MSIAPLYLNADEAKTLALGLHLLAIADSAIIVNPLGGSDKARGIQVSLKVLDRRALIRRLTDDLAELDAALQAADAVDLEDVDEVER